MHALDLASAYQWSRVLQSNRILVDSIILNFYNDKSGSTSSNDDCAKGSQREHDPEHKKEHKLVIKSLIYRSKAMIIFYLSLQRNIPPIPRTWYTPGSTNYLVFFVCLPKGTYHRSRKHGIHLVRELHFYY